MPITELENKTLRQRVYEQLSESLMSGEMYPGQVFSLRELSNKMNVSIMPIREAIWQLESKKIVIIENNRKMWLNTLTETELKDLYHVRLLLETELAEKAVENRTPPLLEKLEYIFHEMEKTSSDIQLYLKNNKEFHFTIYKAAESSIYMDIVRNLWMRAASYFTVKTDSPRYHIKVEPHRDMLDAFIQGDKEKLKRALKEDMDGILNHVLPQLETPIRKSS